MSPYGLICIEVSSDSRTVIDIDTALAGIAGIEYHASNQYRPALVNVKHGRRRRCFLRCSLLYLLTLDVYTSLCVWY
jgi:hypothetical protein